MSIKSRRAFLTGQVPTNTVWSKFHDRLAQEVGQEQLLTMTAPKQARFVPRQNSDVHAAFVLAQHFDITLGLWSIHAEAAVNEQDFLEGLLWVDPVQLNRCEFLDNRGRVYIEPGCTMQQLVNLGLEQFTALPADLQFIAWLGNASYHQEQPLSNSGLQMASMLLADCTVARLGPFGVEAKMELNTATLRRIVPQLFQYAGTEMVQQCLQLPQWPARYRLDAFADMHEVNLAYLVLGQPLRLGWVEWVVLDQQTLRLCPPSSKSEYDETTQLWANEIDTAVEGLFDPEHRFLSLL